MSRRCAARLIVLGSVAATVALGSAAGARQAEVLPSTPITFGFFTARFDPAGTFTLEGEGWPPFKGTWTMDSAGRRALDTGRAGL